MATMTVTEARNYARLSCRVKAGIKQRAEEAALILGQSMTDFTESALAEKAQTVLDQHERITLSERDFARFVEMIENPPPPTNELRSAMADYQHRKIASPDANL